MNKQNPKWLVFTVVLALILVAIVLILGNKSFRATENATYNEFNKRQLILAKGATSGIEVFFESIARDLKTITAIPLIRLQKEDYSQQIVRNKLEELNPIGINDIGIIDVNGILRYSANASELHGTDFSWRYYFQELKKATSENYFVVEYIEFKGVDAGRKGVIIAVPIIEKIPLTDNSGVVPQFAGVVIGTLVLDPMVERFITNVKSTERSHALLIDDQANILWSASKELIDRNLTEIVETFPKLNSIVEAMMSGVAGIAEYDYFKFEESTGLYNKQEMETKFIAYYPVHIGQNTWIVGVWTPKSEAKKLIEIAYRDQLKVIALSILIILFGSVIVITGIIRVNKFLEKEIDSKTKELKESEEKYRKIIETANDAIFIADTRTGIILDANKKAEELIGIPVAELRGLHQSQLHPENETNRYKEIFKDHIKRGKAIAGNLYVQHTDGHLIPVEISANSINLAGREVLLGIFRDNTQRKQAEEEAAERLRELEQFHKITVDREIKMIELKERVKELEQKLK